MPDIKQFKAARSLLDWTQEDLAKASGLSVPAIANMERGSSNPRQDTVDAVRCAFEDHGIEFLDPCGVQLVSEKFGLTIWNGKDSQFTLWNDVYRSFTDDGAGELLLSGINDRDLVDRYPERAIDHVRKLDQLKVKRRILLCEGDNNIIGDNPNLYRQTPAILFAQTPHYIYRDKVALLIWSLPRIMLIENRNIAETFRRQFELNWAASKNLIAYNRIL